MSETTLGIIGGTGLYSITGLEGLEEEIVDTPFGKPSSPVQIGHLGGTKLLFIARHGIGHTLLPSEINYRANIFALKMLGAEWCVSVSGVGSLQEGAAPGDFVVPDQFIDRTKSRPSTFFGNGIVAHVAFADPFCPVLRKELITSAMEATSKRGTKTHEKGTYVCMEGPAFSTRAESKMYRSFGGTVIGMTNLPEAKLAREAEIAYASLSMVTDYDCWRTEDSDVDIEEILKTLHANAQAAKEVISNVAPRLQRVEPSALAKDALKTAIITQPENISPSLKDILHPIIGRYVS